MIDTLNERFGLAGLLEFSSGRGNLPVARITSDHCQGEIYLHGAHVTSWQPTGQADVLWLSESSTFEKDRPIRGGVPICWPWFGNDKTRPEGPAHGFARICDFSVTSTARTETGDCIIVLELEPNAMTRAMWPLDFHFSLTATFGSELDIRIRMENRSDKTVTHTAALHSYLRVGAVDEIELSGFAGSDYLDKVLGFARGHQQEEPKVSGEIDRIYLDTAATCKLSDPGLERVIKVAKTGSRTTVLWNPGAARSKQMMDLDDGGYRNMLCIESANAADNLIELAPGERHSLGTTLTSNPR